MRDRCFTVSRPGDKVLDSAFWVEEERPGYWTLNYYVVDARSYIAVGSNIDEYAIGRVTNPFPPRYAHSLCAILPQRRRNCLRYSVRIDSREGTARLVGAKRQSVSSLANIEWGDLRAPHRSLEEPLSRSLELASWAATQRSKRPGVGRFGPTQGIVPDACGREQRIDGHLFWGALVAQELEIVVNSTLTAYLARSDVPLLYLDLNNEGLLTTEPAGSRATGPYGYASFTGVMRRFSDLVCQRQAHAFFYKDDLPYSKEEIAEICKRVNEARTSQSRPSLPGQSEPLSLIDTIRNSRLSDPPAESVKHEISWRLQNEEMSNLDIAAVLVLSGPSWSEQKLECVDHLRWNLFRVRSVFQECCKVYRWKSASYRTERTGLGDRVGHKSYADIMSAEGTKVSNLFAVATSKRVAEQRALLLSMCDNLGLDLPVW